MTAAAVEAQWSWTDNKIFEDALVKFPEEVPNRMEKIAGCLPGKSPYDVMVHYNALLHDVANIEAGLVQLPTYSELPRTGWTSSPSGAGGKSGERKKGKSWTVREHMLFLRGLQIYGKSDWRSISRNVVISRLPSQVASHAQKFFNRLKSGKKERKRSSIHDITSVSDLDSPYIYTDPDSPYTPSNGYPSTEPSPYTTSKAYSTEQSAFTPSMAYFSTEQSSYIKAYPSTEQSAYPSTEQSPLPHTTSNAYHSTEQSPLPYTTSNAYPSTEQSSYTTSKAYHSTEPSPYSMDCLAFGDINNMDGASAVMAIPETDVVVPVPPINPYIHESYPLDYSFGDFNHLQM